MSSVSSTGSNLYSFFQSINAHQSTTLQPTVNPNSAANATGVSTTGASTSAGATTFSAQTQGAHRRHGHHGGGGGGLEKLQSAVTSALQTAQSSDPSTDPNQVIEDAIAKVFQNSNAAGGADDSTTPASTTTPGNSSATATTDPATANPSFLQTLEQYGVDPSQFHSDFLSAVKQAQSGQADSSAAFQSFPPGTAVDTFA